MEKWSRVISILVVVIIIAGGMATLIFSSSGFSNFSGKSSKVKHFDGIKALATTSGTVYISGTFVINKTTIDPLTGQRGKYGFDANVVVTATGKLVVENATLYFMSDVNHRYSLTVLGSLYFYNATFTLAHGLIQPYYPFNFKVNGPSTGYVKIINSRMLFPGWFNVTNRKGNVIIENTTFNKMPASPTDYPAPPGYGPTPYFLDSKVYIFKSKFENLFSNATGGLGNVGWINDTATYTVGSSAPVEISNFVENPSLQYSSYWDYVILKGLKVVVNYSNSTGYTKPSYFIIKYGSKQLLNESLVGKNGGGSISTSIDMIQNDITITPNQFYQKLENGGIQVYVTNTTNGTVTISGVYFGINIEKNLVTYGVNKFSFNVVSSTLYMRDVYIDVDFGPRVNLGVNHHMIYMNQSAKIYALNLTVNDTGTTPRYDTAFLMVDSGSTAYILRYSVTKVYFRSNVPIDGLKVMATPYPVDVSSNPALISEMLNVIDNYLINTKLVNGMGFENVKVAGNYVYGVTSNGTTTLPLLSDIINSTESPNSKYVGIYKVKVEDSTKTYYTGEIGLGYYPWLLITNNTQTMDVILSEYKDIDLGISSLKIINAPPYVPGKDLSVQVNVKNYGKDTATDVFLYLYVNGNNYGTYNLGTVNGGASEEKVYHLSGSAFSTNGAYNITVEVVQKWDYNLDNNMKSVDINVGNVEVSEWKVGNVIRYHNVWVNFTISSVYPWDNVGVYLYLDNKTTLLNSTVVQIHQGSTQISLGWYIGSNITSGTHSFIVYLSNGLFIGSYSITVEKDVDMAVESLSVFPQQCYVGETINIQTKVANLGKESPNSAMVYVLIYDPLGTMLENKSFSWAPSSQEYAVSFVPNMAGQFRVEVKIVASGDYMLSNNIMSKTFTVYTEPFTVSTSVKGEYVNGTNILVNVTITSNVNANVTLMLYIPAWNVALAPGTPKNPIYVKANSQVVVGFLIPKNLYQKYLKDKESITVSYQINITSDATGDAHYIHTGKQFVIKEKTNFVLTGFYISQGEKQVSTVAEGVKVDIHFVARNYGGLPGQLEYVILDNGKPLVWGNAGIINPGSYKVIFYNYTVGSLGTHNITVKLNPNGTVEESIYGDDVASKSLTVVMPALKITVTSYSLEHGQKLYVGDTLVVVVKIINMNATESQGKTVYMKGVMVRLTMTGGLGTYTQVTNSYGLAIFHIKATAPGTYKPQLQLSYQNYQQPYVPPGMAITVEKKPFEIPWLWIIIIVIIAVIAGFFLYGYITFKKEAPEYMVCGNCGHLIPADAEKCPYCGVVFEKEKVKCPECGSWIDEDSKFCPVCGTLFMPPEDPDYKKYERFKENYEKYIAKYKQEAKKYIGEEFTTEEFFKWWKTHPEFISFLEWIKRQEEKIEGDTIKCPVCGSLNPKDAKICRVCGSPLPTFKESEKENEEEENEKKEVPVIPKEEIEKMQRSGAGVVTVEEWVQKKEKEKSEKSEVSQEEKEQKKKEDKPVVKKKVIKKVIALKKKEEE